MNYRIEQEIDKTLECVDSGINFQVSPLFAENLTRKIAGIRVSRVAWYRGRMLYPVMIIILMILNFSAVMISRQPQPVDNVSNDQASILASEYGVGQNSYMTF